MTKWSYASMSVSNSTPGQIQVIKRTGDVASFDAEKISVANLPRWY